MRVWVWVRARVRARVEGCRRGLSVEDCVVVGGGIEYSIVLVSEGEGEGEGEAEGER